MTILSSLETAYAKVLNVRDSVRETVVTAGILVLAAVFIACASGFAIAAGYMWLETRMPAPAAALCVAGGLALAGLLIIAVAMSRRRSPRSRSVPPAQPQPTIHETRELADLATREIMLKVSKSPGSAALTAVALGIIVGLLRPGQDD